MDIVLFGDEFQINQITRVPTQKAILFRLYNLPPRCCLQDSAGGALFKIPGLMTFL